MEKLIEEAIQKIQTIQDNSEKLYQCGNEDGYVIGEKNGIEQGKQQGYSEGYEKGHSDGYEAGKAEGGGGDTDAAYQEGLSAGIEQGKQAEYDRFWDDFQQNGDRKSYRYSFAGAAWSEETLKPKYPIKIIDTATNSRYGQGVFYYLGAGRPDNNLFDMTEICKRIDFSKAINLQYLCFNAKAKNVTIDASSAQNLSSAFQSGDAGFLDNLTLTVSSACNNYNNTFINASALKKLTFTPGSEIAANISLQYSSKLTRASIESVISALSPNTSGLSLTLSINAVATAFNTTVKELQEDLCEEWNELESTKTNWHIPLL